MSGLVRRHTQESFDALGEELHLKSRENPELIQVSKAVSAKSMAIKLGQLDKGKALDWWNKRKELSQCLADEVLVTDLESLGLNQKSGPHNFVFEPFPALPVLDLTLTCDVWKIAEPRIEYRQHAQQNFNPHSGAEPTLDAWLKSTGAESRDKVEWLHVPDKVEYQLLTRKLDASRHDDVLAIGSLKDIRRSENKFRRLRQQKPLILTMEASVSIEDVQALANYRQGCALLIISSSQLVGEPDSNINRWTWTLLPSWRKSLVEWVETCLNSADKDTFFTSQAAQDWLEKFDPGHSLFVSVEDVLTLCQALHEKGEKEVATNFSEKKLLRILGYENPTGNESDHDDQELLSSVIKARWNDPKLAWTGKLPEKVWKNLASRPNANGSKKVTCNFNKLAKDLISYGQEGYDFRRPIVIRLLVRSYLRKKMIQRDLASWTNACFDRERRPMVDAALNAISLDELSWLALELREQKTSAQNVGAGEAVFIAIGRRIIKGEEIKHSLSEFVGHLIKQLEWEKEEKFQRFSTGQDEAEAHYFLRPWSVQIADPKARMEWVSACWAWSLQPQPGITLPSCWLFPGWSHSLPETLPQWLRYCPDRWEQLPIPQRDFVKVIHRWMEQLEAPPKCEELPPQFSIAWLAQAATKRWPLDAGMWPSVFSVAGSPLAEQALLDLVESKYRLVNRSTALAWWPSLVGYLRNKDVNPFGFKTQADGDPFSRDPQVKGYLKLVAWVMEHLDGQSKEAFEALDGENKKFLAQHLSALPAALKQELLLWLVKIPPENSGLFNFSTLLSGCGDEEEEINAVESLVSNSGDLGEQAARHLWQWRPDRAKKLLEERSTAAAAQNLAAYCPRSALGLAIKLLQEDPKLMEKTRLQWARAHLPDAREHAQDLMKLIRA